MKPNDPEFKRPNPDAMAWAKHYQAWNPGADLDKMHSWFANAMMDMYDHVHWTVVRQLEQQIAELTNKQPTQQQETEMETKQTREEVKEPSVIEVVAKLQWPPNQRGSIVRLRFDDYRYCFYRDGVFWVYFSDRRCHTFRQEDVLSSEVFPASEGRYQGLKAQEDEEAKRGEVSLEAGGDLKIKRTGNTVTYRYANTGVLTARPEGEDESDTDPVPQGGAQPIPLTREESIQILRAFDIDNPRVHEAIGILTREPQLDPPLNVLIWVWDEFMQGWFLGIMREPKEKAMWLPYDAIEQPKEQQ